MKKTLSSILAIALCFCSIAETGNSTNRNNSDFRFSISGGYDFSVNFNKPFQDFISEEFGMDLPSTRHAFNFAFYTNFGSRVTYMMGAVLRPMSLSKNDITLEQLQSSAYFTFAVNLLDNKNLRLSPLMGITLAQNNLTYNNNQSLTNPITFPDVMNSSHKSLQFVQKQKMGMEFGFMCDVRLFDNMWASVYIKWEQSFANSHWTIQNRKVEGMPKFKNNNLAMGIMIRL